MNDRAHAAAPPSHSLLAWPPPGLERLHARLGPAVATLAAGDLVLIAPLFLAVAVSGEPWSTGSFRNGWWLLLLTTGAGILVMLAGLERLARLLFLAGQASSAGHSVGTILEVLTDGPRDTGFVLQGARVYRNLPVGKRDTVLATRVVGNLAYLAAALWFPAAFTVSTMLASRGLVGPGLVRFVTIVIPLGLIAIGLGGSYQERFVVRGARRDPQARAASADEERALIAQWTSDMSRVRAGIRFGARSRPAPTGFRWMFGATVLLGVVILVPAGTLAFTSAIGPLVFEIGFPAYGRMRANVAGAGALRRFRAPTDASISAEAGGDALQALLWTGRSDAPEPPERAPVRRYEDAWLPDVADSMTRSDSIFDRVRGGPSADFRAVLQSVAAHPAHVEWETAARAPAADVLGARFELPFDGSVSPLGLPVPRFGSARDGARAHTMKAAWEFLSGRPAQAERTVREVVSVGLLLMDEGPTLIDAVIGAVVARRGAEALANLYRVTGRTADARAIDWVLAATTDVRDQGGRFDGRLTMREAVSGMPRVVLDTTEVPAFRWEGLGIAATFARCVTLQAIVFGPGIAYDDWLANARASLARRPSDAAYFEMLQGGWFGRDTEAPGGVLPTLIRIVLGKRGAAETCGASLGYW